MVDDVTEEEFREDSGVPPAPTRNLRSFGIEADQPGTPIFRLAIKQLPTLRWVSRLLLARLKEHEPGGRPANQARRVSRWGEGAVESGRA